MIKLWCYKSRIYRFAVVLLLVVSLIQTIDWQSNHAKATTYKNGFTYNKLSEVEMSRMIGVSYPKEGALISLSELRSVKVRYINFKGKTKVGTLIVNKKIAEKTAKVFYELYKIKYPIQKIETVDTYGGDDERSMSANNTSAFNYRLIAGSKKLSQHAKGMAIDINPKINPCVKKGVVQPANGSVYANRSKKSCKGKYKKYMIRKNDKVYKIFKKYGFSWGGDWRSLKDYQHFEIG